MGSYGGLAGSAPRFAGMTAVAAFASLGLPGFSGFIAEFQIFTGSLPGAPVATALAFLGILITAALFLRAYQRIFLGPPWSGHRRPHRHRDRRHRTADGARRRARPVPPVPAGPHGTRRPHPGIVAEPMNTDMARELARLLPELFLAAGAVFGLLLGSYLPRRLQWLVRLLAVLVCAGGLVATVAGPGGLVFENSYSVDVATNATRVVVLASVPLVLGLATAWIHGHRRETEFVVLLLLGALGAVMMAGASDLLLLAAAYLLASVPLYALTGFAKDGPGTEATLKFYLMGALLGVTMLFGVMLLFGIGGATDVHRAEQTAPGSGGRGRHGAAARRPAVQGRCRAGALLGP